MILARNTWLLSWIFTFLVLWQGARSFLAAPSSYLSSRSVYLTQQHQSLFLVEDLETIMDLSSILALYELVDERTTARNSLDYPTADLLKQQVEAFPLPPGFRLILEDVPYSSGGGSVVKLAFERPKSDAASTFPSITVGVLQLAHMALGMAASHAERNAMLSQDKVDELAEQATQILRQWVEADAYLRAINNETTMATIHNQGISWERFQTLQKASPTQVESWCHVEEQLSGRKAADAAFWFALAGAVDDELFQLLTQVCTKELKRFGTRPSCQVKDIVAIADKLAAAGVRQSNDFQQAFEVCLKQKRHDGKVDDNDARVDTSQLLALHGQSCTHMIWKFASRQRKQKSFLSTAAKHWEAQTAVATDKAPQISTDATNLPTQPSTAAKYDWHSMFADPTRPLVVDIGCGMGLSLLGLASGSHRPDAPWHGCNFVGVDLSSLAIRYASGMATRWELGDILQFVVDPALQLILDLQDYPGSVDTVLIQFPTPFRLVTPDMDPCAPSYNSQLPESIDDGFMVTLSLLEQVHRLIIEHPNETKGYGKVIIQSNCEDVAMWIHNTSCYLGFQAQEALDSVRAPEDDNISQRTQRWIASGGARAVGSAWSRVPLLPREAWTETEVACELINHIPVHRCTLRPIARAKAPL